MVGNPQKFVGARPRRSNGGTIIIFDSKICITGFRAYFCTPFNSKAMAVTRLKRKNRKDKAKSAVRRQSLKLQNFQPVLKTVDVEKIKEEFKAKKKA